MCVHSTSKSSTKFYHLFGARRFVSPLGTLLVILFIYLFIYFVMVCNPLISLGLLVLSKTNKVESCLSHQIYYQSTFSDVLVIAMVWFFFFLGWVSTKFGYSERLRSLNLFVVKLLHWSKTNTTGTSS